MASDNIYNHILNIVEVTVNTIGDEAWNEGFDDLEQECEKFLTSNWRNKELKSEDWEGIRDFARKYEESFSLIKNEAYKLKDFRPVMNVFRELEEDMRYTGKEMQPQPYATEKKGMIIPGWLRRCMMYLVRTTKVFVNYSATSYRAWCKQTPTYPDTANLTQFP